MSTWRKRPIVVEAFLWTAGPDQVEDPEWFREAMEKGTVQIRSADSAGSVGMWINTGDGSIGVVPPIWIIKGVKGEIYPCAVDVFANTYDPVPEFIPPAEECPRCKEIDWGRSSVVLSESKPSRLVYPCNRCGYGLGKEPEELRNKAWMPRSLPENVPPDMAFVPGAPMIAADALVQEQVPELPVFEKGMKVGDKYVRVKVWVADEGGTE